MSTFEHRSCSAVKQWSVGIFLAFARFALVSDMRPIARDWRHTRGWNVLNNLPEILPKRSHMASAPKTTFDNTCFSKLKAPLVPWQWHTICVSLFWFICFVHSAHVSYAEKSPSSKSRDLSKAKNNPPHFSYCKTHILHHNIKTFQNNNDCWITNRSGWSSKCSALLKIPSPFNLRRRCLHFSKKFVFFYEM